MAARDLFTLQAVTGTAARVGRVARGKALARPMGAVAIRMPERLSAQIAQIFPSSSPRIFVHEGARQALERRLMAASPGPVTLSITDNRHSIISHTWERGILRARVHHMFLDAPPQIRLDLVRYFTQSDRDASLRLGQYIEAHGDRLARRALRNVPLVTAGKHHDLLQIFEAVNAKYFDGTVNTLVTWGKRTRRREGKRSTIKLGSYSANERLIRIHPSLDRSWVPRYFVAFIVFHEMLHHVIPVRRGMDAADGRRVLHPPDFREREREFHHFERALRWEKQHIGRLLRT